MEASPLIQTQWRTLQREEFEEFEAGATLSELLEAAEGAWHSIGATCDFRPGSKSS